MKVKIINENYSVKLEESLNEFLEKITKDNDIVDIKFKYDRGNYATAMVMYEPKLIMHVERIEEDSDRIMEAYEKNLERVNGVLL